MKSIRWLMLGLVLAVQACGGGGGGGGSPGLVLNASSLSFLARQGAAAPAAQSIHAHINNSQAAYIGAGYLNGQTKPDWLSVSISGSGQDFDFAFTITGTGYAVGTLNTVVTIGTADSNGNILDTQDVAVSYQIKGAVAITSSPVTVSILQGTAEQTFPVAVSTDSLQYQASSSVSWLKVPSGPLSAASFNVTTAAAGLAPGQYSGAITVTDTSDPTDTSTLNVSLAVEPNRLLVSDVGIALAQFSARTVLSRSVTISSLNGRTDLPWHAASSEGWLSATVSGNTGGTLILTANPLGLQPNTFYEANVTVSSTDASLPNQESIRVGLWMGSTQQTAQFVTGSVSSIALNPVEPVLYVNNGTTITRYNPHTLAPLGTFASFSSSIGEMHPSSDGKVLFVSDIANNRIVPVDADTGGAVSGLPASYPGGANFAYGRINGRPILAYGGGSIIDVTTGATLGALPLAGYQAGKAALSRDGRNVYVLALGYSPSTLQYYTLDYSWLTSKLTITTQSPTESGFSCTNGEDLAVSPDQSLVYVACGAPYTFAALDSTTLNQTQTLASGAYPAATAVSWNGLFVGAGGTDPDNYNDAILHVYDASGAQRAMDDVYDVTFLPRSLFITGDGAEIAALTQQSWIALQPMP